MSKAPEDDYEEIKDWKTFFSVLMEFLAHESEIYEGKKAFKDLKRQYDASYEQLLSTIDENEYEPKLSKAGLIGNQLDFKFRTINKAIDILRSQKGRFKKYCKDILLDCINVILKSLLAALLPIVDVLIVEAIEEFKSMIHNRLRLDLLENQLNGFNRD